MNNILKIQNNIIIKNFYQKKINLKIIKFCYKTEEKTYFYL